MEEKQLYLRQIDEEYVCEFDFQSFDVNKMNDKYFLFKEAAIVILYPDGTMEAIRSGSGMHHNFYYRKLYEKSERFREAVDSIGGTVDFDPDESTIQLDCLLSRVGISSLHNVNIPNIPFRLEDLESFDAVFYVFKAEQPTNEVEENLKRIYDNYPNDSIVKNQYCSTSGRFERENKEEIRRM